MDHAKGTFAHDALASMVVFLVALPLCMGIAIASGAPPAAGLITGIIGGIVVGTISGCPLQVSGPAAGLAVIVFELIRKHGIEMLGPLVVAAGVIQLVAGALKFGQLFRAMAPAVIYGMLAGIGILIFAAQFHVMVDDAPREHVHREHDLALPGTLPETPEETPAIPPAPSPASDAAAEDARAAAAEAAAKAAAKPVGGAGLRPFHPLVIALASGANFVARCFSGEPNETASILVEAIRHPGFSFVEILSPCVTFRPEQREWKSAVRPAPVAPTDDAARAARRLMTDDGFNIGVLYKGNRPVFSGKAPTPRQPVEDLECQFRL